MVPRPDTETVVELARNFCAPGGNLDRALRIADLGTGSGAILLALLSELPAAQGFGTDISQAALQTAGANAARAGLSNRTTFIACDYASGLAGPFDLIVSNPPYIRTAEIHGLAADVRKYDPPVALDGGPDGLDAYRALIPQAAGPRPGRSPVVEAGGSKRQIQALMTAAGVNACDRPKAAWRAFRGPSRATKWPDKLLLERKKTPWNIPRERLRSAHNIAPGCWPRKTMRVRPEFSKREPAE